MSPCKTNTIIASGNVFFDETDPNGLMFSVVIYYSDLYLVFESFMISSLLHSTYLIRV